MTFSTWQITACIVALTVQSSIAQEIPAKPAADAAPMMTLDRATFLKMVSSSNEFEIQSSTLAKQNAHQAGVKKAADMIIADHKKAGEKLEATLETKGAAAGKPTLEPKHRKMLDQLESVNGKDFDLVYLDMQAQAHMEAIGLFRTYAGVGDDQAIVGFARETLPSLETHLGHVKMLIAEH